MSLLNQLAKALSSGSVEIIDLTHTLEERTPIFKLPDQFAQQIPVFQLEEISRFDERGPDWYWNNIHCGEHTGTHFDAPAHWISGKDFPDGATDKIPVRKFIAPACVIDVSDRAGDDEEFVTTMDDIEKWEAQHGRIPAGSWALIRTGWSSRNYTERFLNMREDGVIGRAITRKSPSSWRMSVTLSAWALNPWGRMPVREPPFPNRIRVITICMGATSSACRASPTCTCCPPRARC